MTTATPATITIEGTELPILPTPMAQLIKALPFLGNGIDTPDAANALADAIFHGIRRAKGEVTLDWIRDNIDLLNVQDILATFLQVNSLKRKEGAASGEATAGQSK